MGARRAPQVAPDTSAQRRCARDLRCSARTRDPESGEWLPAPANQPLCPADRTVLITTLGELPGCYARLSALSASPVRRNRPVRVAPGSRVLVNPEADALMREAAPVLAGWAARVRTVPGLSLAGHGHVSGSLEAVTADCATLAAHPDPLLALTLGPMARTWPFPGGAQPLTLCRHCAIPVSASPSGKHWWPAVCTHAGAVPVFYDGHETTVLAHVCGVCSARLPSSWKPAPPCRHEPRAKPAPAPGPVPAEIEQQIGDLKALRVGDAWITALTHLDGEDAALEILDLRARMVRLLGETPAPPELLDGIPCRSCEAMSSLEVLPASHPDPEKPEPVFCRCTEAGCKDEMTRTEYDDWVRQYDAWVRGAGVLTCRRCSLGQCADSPSACQWAGCGCRARGHRKAA